MSIKDLDASQLTYSLEHLIGKANPFTLHFKKRTLAASFRKALWRVRFSMA